MKKVFSSFLLALTLIFVGSQFNQAEARDYYVGTWRSGYDAYLMTETIIKTGNKDFKCTVKAVQGRDVMYIDYEFGFGAHGWVFSNSDGVRNYVRHYTPIEFNIVKYYNSNY